MVKQLFGKKVKVIHDKHSRGSFPKDIIGKEVFLLGLNGKGTGSDGVKYNRYMICPQNPRIKNLDDLVTVIATGNYYHVLEPELELEKIDEPKGSLKLKKKREENLDEFGQSMVINLKDDEKTIYLSTSLRTTLNLKDGDGIGFAIDTEKSEIYLYQELEPEQGWIIENGQIISSADWREIFQMCGTNNLYYNLASGSKTDFDYPDYEFFYLSTFNEGVKTTIPNVNSSSFESYKTPYDSYMKTVAKLEEPIIQRTIKNNSKKKSDVVEEKVNQAAKEVVEDWATKSLEQQIEIIKNKFYPKYPSEFTLTSTNESSTSPNITYVDRGYTIGSDLILENKPGFNETSFKITLEEAYERELEKQKQQAIESERQAQQENLEF